GTSGGRLPAARQRAVAEEPGDEDGRDRVAGLSEGGAALVQHDFEQRQADGDGGAGRQQAAQGGSSGERFRPHDDSRTQSAAGLTAAKASLVTMSSSSWRRR